MYSDQNYKSAVSPLSRASPLLHLDFRWPSGHRFLPAFMLPSITDNQLPDPFKQLITLRLRAILTMAFTQPVMAENQMHISLSLIHI